MTSVAHGVDATALAALGMTPAIASIYNTVMTQRRQTQRRETYVDILSYLDSWRERQPHVGRHSRRSYHHNDTDSNEPTWENKLGARVKMWASTEVLRLFDLHRKTQSGEAADLLENRVLYEKDRWRLFTPKMYRSILASAISIVIALTVAYVSFYKLTQFLGHDPSISKHQTTTAIAAHIEIPKRIKPVSQISTPPPPTMATIQSQGFYDSPPHTSAAATPKTSPKTTPSPEKPLETTPRPAATVCLSCDGVAVSLDMGTVTHGAHQILRGVGGVLPHVIPLVQQSIPLLYGQLFPDVNGSQGPDLSPNQVP